jgi:hypothetical protein
LNFLGRVSKNIDISDFTKVVPVITELFHVNGWTDNQRSMTKLIGAFSKVVNEPKQRLAQACSSPYIKEHNTNIIV